MSFSNNPNPNQAPNLPDLVDSDDEQPSSNNNNNNSNQQNYNVRPMNNPWAVENNLNNLNTSSLAPVWGLYNMCSSTPSNTTWSYQIGESKFTCQRHEDNVELKLPGGGEVKMPIRKEESSLYTFLLFAVIVIVIVILAAPSIAKFLGLGNKTNNNRGSGSGSGGDKTLK